MHGAATADQRHIYLYLSSFIISYCLPYWWPPRPPSLVFDPKFRILFSASACNVSGEAAAMAMTHASLVLSLSQLLFFDSFGFHKSI